MDLYHGTISWGMTLAQEEEPSNNFSYKWRQYGLHSYQDNNSIHFSLWIGIEDNCIIEGLAETTTLNVQTYVFGKRWWVKPACKWRTPTPQVCREEQSSPTLETAGHSQTRTIHGVFICSVAKHEKWQDNKLTACTARIAKSPGTCWKLSKKHQESRSLVQIWKIQGRN